MKICIENLDAIRKKYQPLVLATIGKFPIFDKNEAYIWANDLIVDVIEKYDQNKGGFGGYLKYRLYYYFLNKTNEPKHDSLNDVDPKGVEIIDKLKDDEDIEKDLIKKLEKEFLEKSIKKLNKRQRDIVYLKYDKNFSHKEIGKLLNISPKTVTNIHLDIMWKLRRLFREGDML